MTDTDDRTLIEQAMPAPDYILTEQIVLPVPASVAFDAVSSFDLTDIRQPAARTVLWLRALPERLRRRLPPRQPTRFSLDDLVIGTDWLLLGRRPGQDVVLGAVGKFWTPVVEWEPVTPEEFDTFTKPGLAKIVMSFAVLPYGDHRSVVAHEVRIRFFDDATRGTFDLYWWTVRPFVKIVLRGMLHTIRDHATASVPVG